MKRECNGCGSTRFHQAEKNMWICEYCHTRYMEPNNRHTEAGEGRTISPERQVASRKKYIIAGVISAFIIMIGFPFAIIATSSNYSRPPSGNNVTGDGDIDGLVTGDRDIDDLYPDGLVTDFWCLDESYSRGFESITLVPNWTQRIYNGIEVAISHRNLDSWETTFYDGGYLSDLIEIVGGPTSIRSNFTALADTFEAEWRSPDDRGSLLVIVAVSFEPETGMIVSKNIRASPPLGDENSEKIGFALNNIETLSNWTAEIYHNIMPARRYHGFDENIERIVTVTYGDCFYDLTEIVGRPTSTSTADRQGQTIITAIWMRRGNDYSVWVSVDYEQESGMITQKKLSSSSF